MNVEISEELLKNLAGKGAFQRGKDYFNAGLVSDVEQKGNKIAACVSGTYEYQVMLKLGPRELDGACDCPASEGFDFCKHCVALALYVQSEQRQLVQLQRSNNKKDELLLSYLSKLDKPALLQELMLLIKADKSCYKQWQLKAEMASGKKSLVQLKKFVTAALPYRSIYDRRVSRRYFRSAIGQISDLLEHFDHVSADTQLALLIYAYERLDKSLLQIDDSSGERFDLCEVLEDQLKKTLVNSEITEQQRADYLLAVITQKSSDVHPQVSELLSESDEAFNRYFFERLENVWQQAKGKGEELSRELVHTLEKEAIARGDFLRQIELRESCADHERDFEDLFTLCLQHQQIDKAQYWLNKYCEKEPRYSYQTARREELKITLSSARGDYNDAIERQWQLFSNELKLEDYLKLTDLLKMAGQSGNAFFDRAEICFIEEMEDRREKGSRFSIIDYPANDGLISFYSATGHWEQAVELAQQPTSIDQLVILAEWVKEKSPSIALAFYSRAIEKLSQATGNDAYHDVADLFSGLLCIADVRYEAITLLQKVRTKQVRKKNLIKLLDNIECNE